MYVQYGGPSRFFLEVEMVPQLVVVSGGVYRLSVGRNEESGGCVGCSTTMLGLNPTTSTQGGSMANM